MPTYLFRDPKTETEFEVEMSISERDQFLKDNPNLEQLVNGFPNIGYSTLTQKPAEGFTDLLKEIKKRNSRGLTKSRINTIR